jgi:phage shock protein A
LSRQQAETNASIDNDKTRAKAYVAANNTGAARAVAAQIHDNQNKVLLLVEQIKAADSQAKSLDAAVESLTAKHNSILARVRLLESQDRSSKSLEKATSALKAAGALASQGVDSSVDNLAERITARNDVANVEFNRTMSEFSAPPDPLKDAAIDDILKSL